MSLGGYFIVIWCNINQHSKEKTYFYVPICIYLFFSVYYDIFSLNLFEVDYLMLTVYSSHSLPVQGANVIQQHHHLRRALKMLPAKTTKWVLPRTFLLIPSLVSIFARQIKLPQRRGSSSGPLWPQCPGVMPCRVCQWLTAPWSLLALGCQRAFTPREGCWSKDARGSCCAWTPKNRLWPGFQS